MEWHFERRPLAQQLADIHHTGAALQPPRCASPSCGALSPALICSIGFAYLASAALHVALIVRHKQTSDGVPLRELTFVEVGAQTRVIDHPAERERRLRQVFAQEEIRTLLTNAPALRPEDLHARFKDDEETYRAALREFGRLWESLHEHAQAYAYYDALLKQVPDDAAALRATSRILERALEYREACDRVYRAWAQHQAPELLGPLARLAYRARRFDLLKGAASALLEEDPDSMTGHLALICAMDGRFVVPRRRAFQSLYNAASAGGHVGIRQVAASWLSRLEQPIPDWEQGQSAAQYTAALHEALADEGWELEARPQIVASGITIELDLLATAPDGARYAFFVQPAAVRGHIVRALRGQLRALMHDEAWLDLRPMLLTPHPIPWYAYRMMSDAVGARMELMLDADTSMQVNDENIATFIWAAEETYGAALDFGIESLDELDRLIRRWHEFGFGEISHVVASLMASYLGEVFHRTVGGAWSDAEAGPDARAWKLPDDTVIFLIAHIKHCVALGDEEALAQFMRSIIHGERR